jgi:hypothetical protein
MKKVGKGKENSIQKRNNCRQTNLGGEGEKT